MAPLVANRGIKTRFLVISDTHTQELFPPNDTQHAFRHPLPEVDVAIHAGDLTRWGGIHEYEKTLQVMKDIKADLKLVIAGNHDMSLDPTYPQTIQDGTYAAAHALWTGPRAQAAGVTYLAEGTHHFALRNGARLSVHASPYTPEFMAMAFPYPRAHDRFNPPSHRLPGTLSTATPASTIPAFPALDLLITHGPPMHHLDSVAAQHACTPVGCAALALALARARPRMHCFGHIHEGWGAQTVRWRAADDAAFALDPADLAGACYAGEVLAPARPGAECVRVDVSGEQRGAHGEETLLVNAAVMDVRYRPVNAPFVVDLMLDAQGKL